MSFCSLAYLHRLAISSEATDVFGKDPASYAYSLSNEAIRNNLGVDIVPHLNTGLVLISRETLDLNLVEKWLSLPVFPSKDFFAEQTIIAALASRREVKVFPKEYNMGRSLDEKQAALIHYCGHYLSETRIAMRSIGQLMILQQLKSVAQNHL